MSTNEKSPFWELPVSDEDITPHLPLAPSITTREELKVRVDNAAMGLQSIAIKAYEHYDRACAALSTLATLLQKAKSKLFGDETGRRNKIGYLSQRIATARLEREKTEREYEEMYRKFIELTGMEALNIKPEADAEGKIQLLLREQEGFDPDLYASLQERVRLLSISTTVPDLPPAPIPVLDDDLPPFPTPISIAPLVVVEKPADLVQMETELRENAVGANDERRLPALALCLALISLIFGASMALFGGFVNIRGLTEGDPASIVIALIFGAICTVILYFTGYTLRSGWRDIAEWRHGEAKIVPIGPIFFTLTATFFAFAETLMEGKAIQAYRKFQFDKANLLHHGSGQMDQFWTYWMMGCLIAAPILLAEACSGWRIVSGRVHRQAQNDLVVKDLTNEYEGNQRRENEAYRLRKSDTDTQLQNQISAREQCRTETIAERQRYYVDVKVRQEQEFASHEEARKLALTEAENRLQDQKTRCEKGDLRYRGSTHLHEAVQLVKPILNRIESIDLLTAQIAEDDKEILTLISTSCAVDPELVEQCEGLITQVQTEMENVSKLACGIPLNH